MSGNGQRRVYILPAALYARLTDYKASAGINEAEAVRRLIAYGLDALEPVEHIAARASLAIARIGLREGAAEVLAGHASVQSIAFTENQVEFVTKAGERFSVTARGDFRKEAA